MKVALYARVSTEQQIENYSIPLQKERIRAFCISKGWNDIEEYIDPGYSGSNLKRPALEQLQKDIDKGKISAVIVYRLDRLSRSQRDTLFLIEEKFLPNNVEFISISETIDTSTPFGRAMIGVMSVFAQLERETITERLRSGRLKMVKDEGLWAGGTDANPYGYTRLARGKLVVNEEEARHVKRIFEEYVKLKSIVKVQIKLEKEGFTPLKYRRVFKMIKNRLYVGEVSFAGEWFKGSHEPLISVELFNETQLVNEECKGTNRGKIKNTVFSQKIFCGCCGEPYTTCSRIYKRTNGTESHYTRIKCRRRQLPGQYESKCFNRIIKRSDFEQEVFTRIMNLKTSGEIEFTKNKPVDYTKKIEAVDKKMTKLLELYTNDAIPEKVLNEQVQLLKKEKDELIRKSQEVNSEVQETNRMEEAIKNGIPDLFQADLNTQISFVDLFIDHIIVHENEIDIIWNK